MFYIYLIACRVVKIKVLSLSVAWNGGCSEMLRKRYPSMELYSHYNVICSMDNHTILCYGLLIEPVLLKHSLMRIF